MHWNCHTWGWNLSIQGSLSPSIYHSLSFLLSRSGNFHAERNWFFFHFTFTLFGILHFVYSKSGLNRTVIFYSTPTSSKGPCPPNQCWLTHWKKRVKRTSAPPLSARLSYFQPSGENRGEQKNCIRDNFLQRRTIQKKEVIRMENWAWGNREIWRTKYSTIHLVVTFREQPSWLWEIPMEQRERFHGLESSVRCVCYRRRCHVGRFIFFSHFRRIRRIRNWFVEQVSARVYYDL